MLELIIGTRYATERGLCTLLDLTPYQAQVQIDGDDHAVWLTRANLTEAPPVDDEAEPTISDLLDQACACIEAARAKLASGEAK
jgi:hypothetical protein